MSGPMREKLIIIRDELETRTDRDAMADAINWMQDAETVLRGLCKSIDQHTSEDGHSIYPELIFADLPSGWLRDLKKLRAAS